mmetsp:Transcript_96840/g.273878  ORF Transcript_96840/g.273878 Transcript_96840/m.273878 type:complete len:254 (+) Transcript_96840:569-1330(+)
MYLAAPRRSLQPTTLPPARLWSPSCQRPPRPRKRRWPSRRKLTRPRRRSCQQPRLTGRLGPLLRRSSAWLGRRPSPRPPWRPRRTARHSQSPRRGQRPRLDRAANPVQAQRSLYPAARQPCPPGPAYWALQAPRTPKPRRRGRRKAPAAGPSLRRRHSRHHHPLGRQRPPRPSIPQRRARWPGPRVPRRRSVIPGQRRLRHRQPRRHQFRLICSKRAPLAARHRGARQCRRRKYPRPRPWRAERRALGISRTR